MRARVEKVSPSLARKWLDQSVGQTQRGVRKNRVNKLAHAIESGQWQVTHQGIALSDEGVVLDGQHRLLAIIQAGQTVEMMVMRDVPTEVFHSIDTGASRTPADSLKIAGYTDTNVLASVIRTLLIYRDVVGTTASEWSTLDRVKTTTDILEYLEDRDHEKAALGAVKAGRMVAGAVSRHGASTPVAAANLILMTFPTDIGPTTLAEFNARLCDGVMLPSRSPVLALRRWLVSDSGYVNLSHGSRRPVTVAVFLKAVNDYALGIDRSLSIFRFGTEMMPAPLPPGSIKQRQLDREQALEADEVEDAAAASG